MMLEYFNRQVQLWGKEKQLSLQKKRIAIIGCGGLGSSLAFALGASGIGEIHLVDFDEVSVHNIHRQIAFKLGDEGKAKCEVVKLSIEARCPYVKVYAYNEDFKAFSARDIEVDLIIDGTDNLPVRSTINAYAKAKNTPWVYGSVEEFNGQVCFFEKASFDAVFKVSNKKPGGIAAPMVMHIASLQANLALRYLAGLSIKKDFLYYLFMNDEGEMISQKFGLPTN